MTRYLIISSVIILMIAIYLKKNKKELYAPFAILVSLFLLIITLVITSNWNKVLTHQGK